MATLIEQLKERGWFLHNEGIEELTDGMENVTVKDIMTKALDTNLTVIGAGAISDEFNKNSRNVEKVSGPAVWQIQRIRNAAAPKSDPDGDHGHKFLRLYLTDGVTQFSAVIFGANNVNPDKTPPGTKIFLNPQSVPVCNGFVILTERDFKVLGGTVQNLVEEWKVAKDLSRHKRISGEGGPPPWVPFGKQIDKEILRQVKSSSGFKAMDKAGATKPAANDAFERQRMSTIEEANQSNTKRKTFGGGAREMHDADIAQICSKGFSVDQANTALRNNNYNVTAALQALSIRDNRGSRDGPRDNGRRFDRGPTETANNNDRGNNDKRGPKKRGGRNTEDQTKGLDPAKVAPSAPTTLFDLISSKMNLPEQQQPQARKEENRYPPNDYNEGRRNNNQGNRPDNRQGGRFDRKQPEQRRDDFPKRSDRGPPRDHQRQQMNRGQRDSYVAEFPTLGAPHNRNEAANANPHQHQNVEQRQRPPSNNDTRSTMGSQESTTHKFRQGQRVFAKYWEDNRMYEAIVHEMASSGETCVVNFVAYGNYEEVLVQDIKTTGNAENSHGAGNSNNFNRDSQYNSRPYNGGSDRGGYGRGNDRKFGNNNGPPRKNQGNQGYQGGRGRGGFRGAPRPVPRPRN